MKFQRTGWIAGTVVIAALMASTPARASADSKTIDAVSCQPYGPNTTASELVYNQLGVANPGVTNESVLCPITTDGDTFWSSTAGASAALTVYYRTGAAAGKAACTAFASKATITAGSTYSITANPATNWGANTRVFAGLSLAEISGTWMTAPTLVVLCTLTPKVTLGGFSLDERVTTNSP